MSVCPDCGAPDGAKYRIDDLYGTNGRLRRALEKQAVENAHMRVKILEHEESESYNAMKVRRQERAIRALEAKLKKAGVQPYAPSPTPSEQFQRAGELLREAYTRLMTSEGDARYEDANIELAQRIEAAVGKPTT